jgi:hypothetical protein
VSPGRKRLRRAYRADVRPLLRLVGPRKSTVPFRLWCRMVASGAIALQGDEAPRLRAAARAWCLCKWRAPRPGDAMRGAPWGPDVQRCVCCGSAPCDGSRLGCGMRRRAA